MRPWFIELRGHSIRCGVQLAAACLVLWNASCKQAAPRLNARQDSTIKSEAGSNQGPLAPLEPTAVSSTEASRYQQEEPILKVKKIACGEASFYGSEFAGQPTANGEIFNPRKLTAAHRSLPFGTRVRVLKQGQRYDDETDGVIVTINDRGPFVAGRIIDLSMAAFERISSVSEGVASVCIFSLND